MGPCTLRRTEMRGLRVMFVFYIFVSESAVVGECTGSFTLEDGSCIKINNDRLPWELADDKCANEKGYLGSYVFYKDLRSGKLSNTSMSNGNCYWMGQENKVTYLVEKRRSSFWGAMQIFKYLLPGADMEKDCPVVCKRGVKFNLILFPCTKQQPYVCEFGKPVFVQSKAPKKRPIGKKSYKTVIMRTEEDKSIVGDQLFTVTAAMPTMCSRICLKYKTCELFNFNTVSRECAGYSSSVAYKDGPSWEVWLVKKL